MEKIYSDGAIEDIILEKLRNGEKIQDGNLQDGAVFHNFTSCRENLFNWYPFAKNASILEIGAGMGALTGLFCRTCEKVVALEQSTKRADIIRARYREYDNLTVISDDIFKAKFEEQFDYIILAGVLEYAAMNGDSSSYSKLLQRIKELLKINGKLLLAIENRFGLKYWCGAAEDHTAVPYDGISGYEGNGFTTRYESLGVRTFSKNDLQEMLMAEGFKETRWYYPLPDYKFPSAVFSDEKLPTINDIKAIKWTYPLESELVADEKKLYEEIIANRCFPFFSNSFLIEVGLNQLDEYHIKYACYKRDYKEEYRITTILDSEGNYIKKANSENAKKHLLESKKNLDNLSVMVATLETKKKGDTLVSPEEVSISGALRLKNYLENGNFGEVISIIRILKLNIEKSSEIDYEINKKNAIEKVLNIKEGTLAMGPILKKGYIDMNFNNCFWIDNELVFFDQEWVIEDIPVNFILYRAIKYAYVTSNIDIRSIFSYFGISEEEESAYDNYEKILLKNMMDDERCAIFDPKMYNDGLKAVPQAKRLIHIMDQNYHNLEEKYDNLKKDTECELNEKDLEINKLHDILEKSNSQKQQEILLLQRESNNLFYQNQKLKQEITDKEENIETLQQEVRNKEGHIELLLPAEREYKTIINSKMFKCMRIICHTYDVAMILPRFIGRNVFAFCRMMTHVNARELKIASGYVKNEGFVGAYHHLMRDYHKSDLKTLQLEVEEKIYDEIKFADECEHLTLPYYEKPLVSIVIPAYNQFTYTYYCLKSIIENSGDISYEVILADDCSTDLTTQITFIVDNLVVAKTKSNMLFLRNCNHAAKQAKGEYILFLNNDTQVQKDWLSPLVQLCERDSSIGMVGSKLVYADGTLQEAGGIIWKDGSGWNYGRNDDAMKPEYNYVRDVDYISGAAIMIRHSLWKTIGGFDEYFAPAYCEDSDLAFMVRKAGYRVVYQPASVVVHFEGKSNGTDLNSGVKKYQVENSNKLKEKWKNEFAKQYDNAQCVFKARERSQNKKVILVIDHYVPQFDKDAGSKTTMQYLKMFVQQGYSVKFMGDNFYQDEPYTNILQQMGVEVLYGPWYAQHWKEWILENRNYIDFAYLNRPHITIKYIDFLKEKTNIKCIYYGHDLHFLRLQREYELSGNISKKQESEEWLEKELYIMRKADISYYPSYVEEEEIHRIDPSIKVKAITAYVYEQFKDDIQKDFTLREGILFVGGFGHPPNEDAVLWFTKEVLPRIEEKIPMPFYIVGSKATDAVKKLNSGNIIVKGFVSEEELAQLYNTCKMVVVPLRYGAGVKGKVVEALYYGTPMVTTSVGAEGISGADKIISIADDADSFANAVIETYNDDKKLAATVDAYQAFVKDYFSVDAVWKIIKDDFS